MIEGPSLLLLDDETDILNGVARFFGARGFRVDCATEREAAEALLAHNCYDCVILDLGLGVAPGTEGLELVPFVRDHRPAAAVIVFTAYGSPAIEAEALRRGAHAFLQKPLPLKRLAEVVDRLIHAEARAAPR